MKSMRTMMRMGFFFIIVLSWNGVMAQQRKE